MEGVYTIINFNSLHYKYKLWVWMWKFNIITKDKFLTCIHFMSLLYDWKRLSNNSIQLWPIHNFSTANHYPSVATVKIITIWSSRVNLSKKATENGLMKGIQKKNNKLHLIQLVKFSLALLSFIVTHFQSLLGDYWVNSLKSICVVCRCFSFNTAVYVDDGHCSTEVMLHV